MTFSTPPHKKSDQPDTVVYGGREMRRAAVPENGPDDNARTLVGIRAAITSYYLDLDARKHGGVAQDFAFSKIERMLGMSWADHKAKSKG